MGQHVKTPNSHLIMFYYVAENTNKMSIYTMFYSVSCFSSIKWLDVDRGYNNEICNN